MLHKVFQQHAIHYVTARPVWLTETSIQWLNRYQFPKNSIHHLGTPNKIAKARELNCDLFVEDSLDNARQLAQAGFQVLLLDCSYNQADEIPNVTRVRNWYQIASIIRTMQKVHFAS